MKEFLTLIVLGLGNTVDGRVLFQNGEILDLIFIDKHCHYHWWHCTEPPLYLDSRLIAALHLAAF